MKNHLLILAGLFILSLTGFSQANLVIFSEDGDAFYAYINGVRQNDKPETNVKVTGLSPNVSLRVEFADKALPQLKKAMPLETGFEYAIRIKRDMKKQVKLRYFGQTPIGEAANTGASTVQYHTAETPAYNTIDNTNTNTPPSGNNNHVSVTGSTVTTTTSNQANNNGSVNINMSGTGINMNVTAIDPNPNGMNTTTSTTVTTSSSYTASGHDYNNNHNNNHHSDHRNNDRRNNDHRNNDHHNNPPANNNTGCKAPMTAANFAKMKQAVESKPFSDTKMSTAKVAAKNGCLSTSQVKEICKLFSMDDDKLAYAKYAYEFCVDKANYYQVSDVFSFSSTTDDFNKFLEQ